MELLPDEDTPERPVFDEQDPEEPADDSDFEELLDDVIGPDGGDGPDEQFVPVKVDICWETPVCSIHAV